MTNVRGENYGRGVVQVDSAGVENDVPNPMHLLNRLSSPDYHPPVLPSVALELVSLSRKPSVGIRDIAAMLAQDPVLTADTLRITQSAAFQGAAQIRTIDEALVRLGLRRASDLFFRAALEARLFRCSGGEAVFERLRLHSVATAELARLVCRQTSLFDDSAYLCGLLHDIGIVGCMLAIGCDHKGSGPDRFARIWPTIEAVQAKFALQIAVLWDLPQELRLVLSHHLAFGRTEPAHPLAAVVYLAEYLSTRVGRGFATENDGSYVDKAMKALRLAEGQIQVLEKAAEDAVAALV